MADKKFIDYQYEVKHFVDIYGIVSCQLDQTVYFYDDTLGIFRPTDDVQLSKLASDYLTHYTADMVWTDYNLKILVRYTKTMAPYYERMGTKKVLVLNNGTFHIKDMKLPSFCKLFLLISFYIYVIYMRYV